MKMVLAVLSVVLIASPCFAQTGQQGAQIPRTLEECFLSLESTMQPGQLEEFKAKEENDAVAGAHRGLGMWIRNNWGLWKQSSPLAGYFHGIGIFHPDDMSGIILTSFHRHLNNREINLPEQVRGYQEYWEKVKAEKKAKEKASLDR